MSNKKFMTIIVAAILILVVGILGLKNKNGSEPLQTDKNPLSSSTSSSEEQQSEQKGTEDNFTDASAALVQNVNEAILQQIADDTDPADEKLNKQLEMTVNGKGYSYLYSLKEHEVMGDLPEDGDYKMFNKVISVNDEVNLALSGYESDSKILYLDLTILDKDYDNGIGAVGYNYSDFKTLNTDSASKTEDDTERLVKFINDNQRYPKKGEVQLNGIITFEQYKSLFDQFDLKGRKVQTIVGKSL